MFPNILIQNIELEISRAVSIYEPNIRVNRVDVEIVKDLANVKVYLTKLENLEPLTFEAYLAL